MIPVSQKRNLLSIAKASPCFSSTNAGKSKYLQCYVDIFILLAVPLLFLECDVMKRSVKWSGSTGLGTCWWPLSVASRKQAVAGILWMYRMCCSITQSWYAVCWLAHRHMWIDWCRVHQVAARADMHTVLWFCEELQRWVLMQTLAVAKWTCCTHLQFC